MGIMVSCFAINVIVRGLKRFLNGPDFWHHIFVTNFLLSLTVKEFWKSDNIWWSYGQELGVLFFWLTVYDEKATDQRLQDPVKRFEVNVFNASSG